MRGPGYKGNHGGMMNNMMGYPAQQPMPMQMPMQRPNMMMTPNPMVPNNTPRVGPPPMAMNPGQARMMPMPWRRPQNTTMPGLLSVPPQNKC